VNIPQAIQAAGEQHLVYLFVCGSRLLRQQAVQEWTGGASLEIEVENPVTQTDFISLAPPGKEREAGKKEIARAHVGRRILFFERAVLRV